MYPAVVGTTFEVSYLYYIRLSGFLLTRHAPRQGRHFPFVFIIRLRSIENTRRHDKSQGHFGLFSEDQRLHN
jgi:hypothetical protein